MARIPDAVLPPSPIMPPNGALVASDGAALPYRIKGTGPLLVMIPGWSQSAAMFQHQLDALSDRFTVVTIDPRGHGESPEPAGGLRMARLATDVHELLGHLGRESVHLLGWSMGASILWAYIDLYGTRDIDRIVLVDQPAMLMQWPGMDDEERARCGALFTMQSTEDLCTALRAPDGEATRAAFVRGMVTQRIGADLFEWIVAEDAKTSLNTAAALLWSHCTQDWRDVLGRIDRPTLVVGGAVSHVDQRSQTYIHACIAGSTLRILSEDEGGAHFPFLEAPAVFSALVADFLAA